MSAQHPQEFKRYRLFLGLVTLVGICLGIVWLGMSAAIGAFSSSTTNKVMMPATTQGAADLLTCQRDVEKLFQQLIDTPEYLSSTRNMDRAVTRLDFAQGWLTRWEQVGLACRFSDVRPGEEGNAFGALSRAYNELPLLHRSYAVLVESYLANSDRRVDRIRQALDLSHKIIEHDSTNRAAATSKTITTP